MVKFYLSSPSAQIKITKEKSISIGRIGYGTDIEIDDSLVSRKHCELEVRQGKLFIRDCKSLHGVEVNGKKIPPPEWTELYTGDRFKIISETFDVSSDISAKNKSLRRSTELEIESQKFREDKASFSDFRESIRSIGRLRVGRAKSNDIVLNEKPEKGGTVESTISREHAEFTYENGSFWIADLNSTNGTYLNDKLITNKTLLKDTDTALIEFFSFNLIDGYKDIRNEKFAIKAENVKKVYPNGFVGLNPLSIDILSKNFIALMGPSGCGKSTLLKCLNGVDPANHGSVYIHGLELTKNFNFLKKKIGYVPQDDIIHAELTVYHSLFYAAKLRLPDNTNNHKINDKINEVLKSLNLSNFKNSLVKKLSGGQRKRVSIAVELLTDPTILFLDEPTSPLDPETIDGFLRTLKELANKGTTIVMVTHKPEDLNYVDEVIFLNSKGYLTFFNKPDRILRHFKVKKITEVYALMAQVDEKSINAYYIEPKRTNLISTPNEEFKADKKDSLILQLYWLVLRYFNLKLNDKSNLVLLLAQPLVIAGLISIIFDEFRIGILFLMAISAIWFGVSNAAKEIVGEIPIYKRERMFNLDINTYIFSKWIVLSVIAFVQTIIFVSIIYVKFKTFYMDSYPNIYLHSYGVSVLFMFYISFSSTLLGLLLSAYFDTTEKVMTVVPIALMPQIMLAGVITKVDNVLVEFLSFFMIGRWGTEGFARIQDNHFINEGIEKKSIESVITYMPEIKVDTTFAEFGASISTVLNPEKLVPTGNTALKILDFYNEDLIESGDLIGKIFDSLGANILIVGLLNVALYLLINFALKQKDSI